MGLFGKIRISLGTWKEGYTRSKTTNGMLRRQFAHTDVKKQKWKPAIGLEIHAQIATDSKLFSGASTAFSNPVNSCVSLFDCAIPGTLPVLNKKCVEAGVLTALALSCKINEVSHFERKHYFYADLPAGYQITQQKYPLASDGEISFTVYVSSKNKRLYTKSSRLKQIQLEQDSGRSLHDEKVNRSFIDLNRAGIPLMEFVFMPDLEDGEEAAALVKELSFILQILGTCSCKMEEGAMRIDANVSVSKPNEPLGVRTEIKNIGSVRGVASAVKYEVERQIQILSENGEIINETRAWEAALKKTVPLREKEEKQDYRFMPETNLPPLHLHVNENAENKHNLVNVPLLKRQLPELPEQSRQRLGEKYHLTPETIIAIMSDPLLLKFFDYVVQRDASWNPRKVANFLMVDLLGFIHTNKLNLHFCFENDKYIVEIVDLLQSKTINLGTAKTLLDELLVTPAKMPRQIVEEKNWFLITDKKTLEEMCVNVIKENPELVKVYKSGKKNVINAFNGKVYALSDKRANMALVADIMKKMLDS